MHGVADDDNDDDCGQDSVMITEITMGMVMHPRQMSLMLAIAMMLVMMMMTMAMMPFISLFFARLVRGSIRYLFRGMGVCDGRAGWEN